MDIATLCAGLAKQQRQRIFTIKTQSRMDRSVESYVRTNYTGWRHDMPEDEREAENAKALELVKAARNGEAPDKVLARMVALSDEARAPADAVRRATETAMEKLARQLPVWEWAEPVMGFGAKGLGIIVAETTTASAPLSLGSYTKGLDGIYSRLGFASYGLPDDGVQLAGSTWKRTRWRPRALTADEWVEHPFAASRYAEMFTLAESLFKQQSDSRRATGPYRLVYDARRARTAETHPDWSKLHSHRDAMRVMFKSLIADTYAAWMRLTPIAADGARPSPPERATCHAPRSAATSL